MRNSVSQTLVKNKEKINLSIDLFSADEMPKKITENKTGFYRFYFLIRFFNNFFLNFSGKPIVQNEKDNHLVNGEAVVGRLKINEVSSHFTKGLFNLVVYCEKKKNNDMNSEDCEIDASEIKPLIITNIKVKSKK